MPKPKKKLNNGLSFEDNIEEINRLISIHVTKWNLDAITYIDRDDIANIIRYHVYKKWRLYNSSKPLGNWLTRVITNRLKNLFRNHYYKFAKPCVALKCEAYLGGEECRLFVKTCSECPLYKKWENEKKRNHDVNLTLTIEDHQNTVNSKPFEESNFDEQIAELKDKLQDVLSANEYHIFCALYLENKTEADLIKEMKFSSKTEGVRQIKALKNSIVATVKTIIKNEEIC